MRMRSSSTRNLSAAAIAILLVHALIGWAWCAALIGIGRSMMSMPATLVLHAIGAPLGFALISYSYFTRFAFTGALATAVVFVGVAVLLDVFVVALLIEHSFAMFASPLGTWLPLASIFVVTLLIGQLLAHRRRPMSSGPAVRIGAAHAHQDRR